MPKPQKLFNVYFELQKIPSITMSIYTQDMRFNYLTVFKMPSFFGDRCICLITAAKNKNLRVHIGNRIVLKTRDADKVISFVKSLILVTQI